MRSLVALVALCAVSSMAVADEHVDAAKLLSEWRFDEARTLIKKLENEQPTESATLYLSAELAFLSGDYPASLKLLEKLDDDDVGGNVGQLRQLVASTYATTKDFVRKETTHFIFLHAPGKDEVLVELAGDALEKAYTAFGDDFGVRPSQKVRVEFLTQPSDLAKVSALTETDIRTTSTIALCKYNKLMVVSPRATLFGYAWLDTIVHEYVHFVVSMASRDRVPVWLHEGLARFEQNRWRDAPGGRLSAADQHLLASAIKKNDFISFDAMHPSMAKLPSQAAAALAYAEVYTLVRFAHAKVGYQGIRAALAGISSGTDAREAVAQALGESWDKVESGWKTYLGTLNLKTDAGLAGRARKGGIRFSKGGEQSENVGVDEIANKTARKFTRLGGLLRARGMLEAAAKEYEKALKLVGGDDPLISAKLSRTYLDLRQYGRAIDLAEPLLDADDNDPSPARTLGIANLALGEPTKAITAFEIALRINPFDPSVRCGLADAYTATKVTSLADRERRACKTLRP